MSLMDLPKASLTETEFADMMRRAITGAMNTEGNLRGFIKRLQDPANGRAIHLPDGRVTAFGISPQHVNQAIIETLAVLLQSTRILIVALNDLDTRFRQAEAVESGKVGDERGSQSPGSVDPELHEPTCPLWVDKGASCSCGPITSQGSQPSRPADDRPS